MRRLILLAALNILNTFFPAHATEPWTLYKEHGTVKVYSRITETEQMAVRAVAIVKAEPGALIALLHDEQRGPDWIANCRRLVIEARPSANERVIHVYYSAPWPVEDRDMLIDSVIHYDHQTQQLTISVRDVGGDYPLEKGYVRMENVIGQWQVIRLNQQQVQVTYQGQGSAAGHIPQWLENRLLLSSTYETFLNLASVIQEEVYQVPVETGSYSQKTEEKNR
ncbi:START domain-containing protein [Vibrio mangrovi]|uniref:START domain-containing protein n=1 Tax=Vibrio mangrovi TaxID=474394 RepID=A0A1Y6IN73_9VIBR|nr:START domain-containing protein [Vibrio mangrovi]MDW6004115.1 START domain-containing protein [Vibrio mangrovi]SMR99088.1 hypothetical protein VIM7927_00310 [Vibrio mangrovi]